MINILNKIDALSISGLVKNMVLKNKFIQSKISKPILNPSTLDFTPSFASLDVKTVIAC